MLFPHSVAHLTSTNHLKINVHNSILFGSWVKVGNILLYKNVEASPFVYWQSEVLTVFCMLKWYMYGMRGSRKFCQRGSKLSQCFYFSWWGAIIGQPAKSHCNGVSLAGRSWPNIECWLCSRGPRPVLLRNPIVLWIFRGSGPPAPPPPSSSEPCMERHTDQTDQSDKSHL